MTKTFTLYWKDGTRNVVTGDSPTHAMQNAGYGGGAMSALDFYGNGDVPEWEWSAEQRCWKKAPPPGVAEALAKALAFEQMLASGIPAEDMPANEHNNWEVYSAEEQAAQIEVCRKAIARLGGKGPSGGPLSDANIREVLGVHLSEANMGVCEADVRGARAVAVVAMREFASSLRTRLASAAICGGEPALHFFDRCVEAELKEAGQ